MSSNQPLDFENVKRVLVTKLRFHGDVLLASPVFQALRNHYPDLVIDGLIYEETTDMLSLHPAVDRVFTIDRRWKDKGVFYQLRHESQLFRRLRERRYDLLVHLTDHWRGFLLKKSLGIPHAVVADYPRRRNTAIWQRNFTHIYPLPPEQPITWTHLDALKAIGVPVVEQDYRLVLGIGDEDRRSVEGLLAEHRLTPHKFVHIHPTSRFFYKCWPPEVAARFIDTLMNRGVDVVITAAPSDKEQAYVDAMKTALNTAPVDLSGSLSLKRLAALASNAGCFVGVDSAPMHIATAVDVPLVALFGATNPKIWAPQTDKAIVLTTAKRQTVPALVDGSRPNTLRNCILDIDVDTVIEATLGLLDQNHRDNIRA